MADLYLYPVYFECRDLLEEQMKVIEKYFRVRRRSGGGDCGPLMGLGDNVYGIAFKNQKGRFIMDSNLIYKNVRHLCVYIYIYDNCIRNILQWAKYVNDQEWPFCFKYVPN